MQSFKAKIDIIGVNPFVLVPGKVLKSLFKEAQKEKGPIPVTGTLDAHQYHQTLVKYAGFWRLYLNTPMRKAIEKDVGDIVRVEIQHDARERITPMHPKLEIALKQNKEAKLIFLSLSPHRQKEIMRYINHLKTEDVIDKNIAKAIQFLLGKERFIGRDRP
ncbi:MAG: YdeI/OmpD-associated family protein [Saprospiraceae bacterium]